jgi:hypothetical protein
MKKLKVFRKADTEEQSHLDFEECKMDKAQADICLHSDTTTKCEFPNKNVQKKKEKVRRL